MVPHSDDGAAAVAGAGGHRQQEVPEPARKKACAKPPRDGQPLPEAHDHRLIGTWNEPHRHIT